MRSRWENLEGISARERLRYMCIIGFIIVLAYLPIYFKRKQYKNISRHIPTAYGLPYIGIVYRFLPIKRFLYAITSGFEELNTTTYFAWLGIKPVIVTIDPEILKTITSSSSFLNKAEILYRHIDDVISNGLISSKVTKWKHNRKLINAYFNHRNLMRFIPLFNRGSNIAVERLRELSERGEHKLFGLIKRVILGVAIESTMGIDMREDSSKYNELLDSFNTLMERIANVAAYSTIGFGFLARSSGYYNSMHYLRNFMTNLIKERSNYGENNINNDSYKKQALEYDEESINCFLDTALNYWANGQFENDDVIMESITLIGASFETIATSIHSALVMLAMHHDVQNKLFQEIYTLFPQQGQEDIQITYEHLKQVPYLDMVVAETLRLMPSIPVVARETVRETTLTSKLILPTQMEVIIPIFSLHRAKCWWGPNAHQFNPDNFLPENVAKRHPYVYMPFSKGARNCIGWRYAEIAVRITLMTLVRRFEFSTDFNYEDLHFVDHISLWYDVEPYLRVKLRDI